MYQSNWLKSYLLIRKFVFYQLFLSLFIFTSILIVIVSFLVIFALKFIVFIFSKVQVEYNPTLTQVSIIKEESSSKLQS
jgi:hypothetical protein